MTPALWFVVNGTFVCAPPKCGGTALYRSALGIGADVHDRHVFSTALTRTEFFTPDEVAESGLNAIMAVRDPVSRFASLWRDKCRDTDVNMPELAGLSTDDLMDMIEGNPDGNSHWMPQAVHYRKCVEVVHHRQLLSRLNLRTVYANTTIETETDPVYPVERIVAHYHEDADLFARLA